MPAATGKVIGSFTSAKGIGDLSVTSAPRALSVRMTRTIASRTYTNVKMTAQTRGAKRLSELVDAYTIPGRASQLKIANE
jgi:hypothetical protein